MTGRGTAECPPAPAPGMGMPGRVTQETSKTGEGFHSMRSLS